jgi:hypothetical protein
VKTVFLNGGLPEPVYMAQLEDLMQRYDMLIQQSSVWFETGSKELEPKGRQWE